MTTKALGGVLAAIVGLVAVVCLGKAALFGGGAASSCSVPVPSGAPALTAPAGGWQPVSRFDPEQVGFAATIVSVGAQMGVPVRGWVIAVAVAIQESDLHNPEGCDQDSIGLFQQRPSQGWGTPQQLHDPVHASQKFFEKLLTIPGWQTTALTDAAQAVQTSAYPDAYAKHESDATLLVNTLGNATFWASPDTQNATVGGITCTIDGGDGMPGGDTVALPPGFALPPATPPAVVVAISWALSQLGTPYAYGGDCTAPHSGDPTHQCDCSGLVILSLRLVQGCDLRESVEDTVVDMAAVDTVTPGSLDAIVAELQSRCAFCLPPRVRGVERAGVPR